MSEFVDWLKGEWETLERTSGRKYSTRRLSMEAGLSPNTLYQLLNHPEVTPSTDTCHKLADFFGVESLIVLELAGHVSARDVSQSNELIDSALKRSDLQKLLLTARDLSATEVQIVQQVIDQLRVKKREEEAREVARGAAVALVVEDTADSRALFVNMLRSAGLKVLEASDGQTAVNLIETNGELIDIVLMDYRMPVMDGVEATRKIRKNFADLPILFISAWDDPEMKETAFEAGAAEYLIAPIGYDELLEAVSRVRRESRIAENA